MCEPREDVHRFYVLTGWMITMTTMLVVAADLSNIMLFLLAGTVCFCAACLYIMRNAMVVRFHGDDIIYTSLHHVTPRVPQMNMMKVHIPFTFKLLETTKSSYSEVQCLISSQVHYCIRVFWGVGIRELHICLWRPWEVLKMTCFEESMLQGQYQRFGLMDNKNPHGEEVVTLSLPSPPLNLGSPPRLCYPLVIFLIRCDEKDVHPDETVALVSVIHIKDPVCTLPTNVLAQYLKQANGQLSCLKQLYLATGNANYEEEPTMPIALAEPVGGASKHMRRAVVYPTNDPNSMWNSTGEQLCVVCQYFPLSRALLPCRHTCICASCFNKLDRCPMCRAPIKSYFCIRSEEYMPAQPTSKGAPSHGFFYNWIENWNDRLTDFLGFGR